MSSGNLQTGEAVGRRDGMQGASTGAGDVLYAYDEAFARDLKARAVKGVAWSALARMGGQAIQFVVIIVLARLLLPEDFGLLGMAMVAIAFASVFRDVGLSQAVIQRKELTEQHLSSVFWINLGLGALLTGLLVVSSPWVASFYGRPELVWILIFLSLNMVIASVGQIPNSLFQRQLKFKTLCFIGVGTATASGALAITLAYLGFGVWSLIIRALVGSTLRTGALWLFTGWRPRFSISYVAVKPLLAFGLPLLGFAILNYFNRQFDHLLIGKVLGAQALGYYTMAYMIMLLPLGQISGVACGVAFPVLSSIQEQKERVATLYLRVLKTIAIIVFPLMAGVAVLAPVGVPWALGEKWLPAVLPIQILALLGTLQALYTTVGTILRSQGRTGLELRTFVFVSPIIVASFFIGIRWGVVGVCIAYAAVMLVVMPVVLRIVLRLVGSGLDDLFRCIWSPALCTGIMAVVLLVMWLARPHVTLLSQDIAFIALGVCAGALTYFLAGWLMMRDGIRSVWALAQEGWSPLSE